MYYERVFEELNGKKVRYLIVGGMAVVLHGIVRLTADLDIMIDLGRKNAKTFVEAMTALGYKPRVPVKAAEFVDPEKRASWMKEKDMKVFSFFDPKAPMHSVDVFVYEPIDFESAYARRKTVKAGRLSLPVVSIEDLKALKVISGRGQDLADIKSLEGLKETV
jgi:hypothetical protein